MYCLLYGFLSPILLMNFFIDVPDLIEISLCSIPNDNETITTKLCGTAVMASG